MDVALVSVVMQSFVIIAAALWFVARMKASIDGLNDAVKGLSKTVRELDRRVNELEKDR